MNAHAMPLEQWRRMRSRRASAPVCFGRMRGRSVFCNSDCFRIAWKAAGRGLPAMRSVRVGLARKERHL